MPLSGTSGTDLGKSVENSSDPLTPHSRRDTRHNGVVWHVAGDDGAGADHGAFADGDAAEDDGAAANRGAAPDGRRHHSPVSLGLQMSAVAGRARMRIVDEHYPVAHEDLVLNRHALADERVG